eukprot:gene21667-27708_t
MLHNKHVKEEAIRQRLEEKRQKEQQAGPTITRTGMSVQRSVGDMLAWEETRRAKLQSLAAERRKLEDAEMTGRPVLTKAAERVSQKWKDQEPHGAEGVPSDAPSSRPQTQSKPVEERLLEYEEMRRAKLQHAVQQQEDNIRRMAVPVVAPHSTTLERTGDVVDRLYGLATAQHHARETQEAYVTHTMQHDRETGQKLFQPRLNANSERMVSRTRPSVPVEVLLNHRGQQQQAKLAEKGRRIDSRAQQLRENAARLNPISERLAARKMAKEGVDASAPSEVRLSGKSIGHVKASILQGIQEPSFKPTISKGSRSILAASHSHQASGSGGSQLVHYRRFAASNNSESTSAGYDRYQEGNDRQWREDMEGEDEDEAGPYVDERMVYGERRPHWREEESAHETDSPSDYFDHRADDWYSEYRSDHRAAPLSDDRLFDPTQHSLLSHGAAMVGGGRDGSGRSGGESSGTHSVYSRSKQWDDERQRKRERDRLLKEQEELAECSFRPNGGGGGGGRSKAGGDSIGSVSERQAAWAAKREHKLELERQRALEEEMRDCSFAPRSHRASQQLQAGTKTITTTFVDSSLPPPPPPPFSEGDNSLDANSVQTAGRVPLPSRSLVNPPVVPPRVRDHQQSEYTSGGGAGRIPLPLSSKQFAFSSADNNSSYFHHEEETAVLERVPVPLPTPSSSNSSSVHSTSHLTRNAPSRPTMAVPLLLRELEADDEEDEGSSLDAGRSWGGGHNIRQHHHQQQQQQQYQHVYDKSLLMSGDYEDQLHSLELEEEEEEASYSYEAAWRAIFYTGFVILGYFVLFTPETAVWIIDTKNHFNNWPHHPITPLIDLYYTLGLGCYLHQLMWTEVSRSDAAEMILHHLITILLIVASYLTNYTRIGASILLVHDVADVFLEVGKCFNYMSRVKEYKRWATTITDSFFACFAISFFVSRLVLYPRFLLFSFLFEGPAVFGGIWPGYWYFAILLSSLQCLHIFWFYLICRMIYRLVTTGIEKDERSDDEEVVTPAGGSSAENSPAVTKKKK